MAHDRSSAAPGGSTSKADLILIALFQSRLRERSVYLGQLIQTQRRRLSSTRMGHDDGKEAASKRIEVAEQSLAAVQRAEERMDSGLYGLCDRCGGNIDWDTLLEAPEQPVCPSCLTG